MLSPVQFLGLLILFVLSQAQRDESAASLGGAKVGFYSRQSGLSGSGLNVVSLGGAPVGAYQRQQSPQQWYRVPRVRIIKQRIVRPFVRVVTVPPAIKPTPKVTKPRKPVSKPHQPKPKPSKITGRQAGGLLGLGGGGQKGILGLGGLLGLLR